MSVDGKGRLLQTENDEVAEGIDVDIKGSKTCQRGSLAYLYLSVSLVPNYITRSCPEGGCAIIFVHSPVPLFRCIVRRIWALVFVLPSLLTFLLSSAYVLRILRMLAEHL